MPRKPVLLLVDLQNDFCQGGSLAVPGGEHVIPLANMLQDYFDEIIATQDWHPRNHTSFAANHPGRKVGDVIDLNGIPQVLWPVHCVQHSHGAAFYPDLNTQRITTIFHKGATPALDSYSAFFDNAHQRATGLGDYLRHKNVDEIYVMGLATDYCVKYTVLDAIAQGYRVTVIQDGCRGVELQPGDTAAAFAAMVSAGATLIESSLLR